jgi:hypothetical protein
MRMSYFGDSHDIVKQSLLRWLRPFGEWSVHPMFTEPVSATDVSVFERFLGAKVISTDVLTSKTNRSAYFSCSSSCGNLLLDPDTGIRLKDTRGVRANGYLFAGDLARIVEQRTAHLTVVFDQSVGRGSEQKHLETKLRHFIQQRTFAFAHRAQARFVIGGRDRSLIERARNHIIAESKLPESRFLPVLVSQV